MKRKILSLIALVLMCQVAVAQDAFAPILSAIEQNNTTLRALREQMDAEKLGNKTGLTPANPEVEFGYLWGTPAANGNRKDVSIRQTFDFPTVYQHRGKLADLRNLSVEHQYGTERMQLLLGAKKTCVELVYYNALAQLYEQRLLSAKKIASVYERKHELGEANQIDYNKAMLNFLNMENELVRIHTEQQRLLAELQQMNGGEPVQLDKADFDSSPALPLDFEAWYAEAEDGNPALQYLKSQIEANERQVKLTKASALPKLSVGYMGEFVRGQHFQGVTLGMSIPLWADKGRVRHSQAVKKASESMAEDARVQYYNNLQSLYAQALALRSQITTYSASVQRNDNTDLLLKAYEKGELSLLNYILETEYLLASRDKLLQSQRDLAILLAEFNAYTL